ncbi:MAG: Sensor protein [uncultured bacterium]|nr:MAG: Sensor protein [uncultured bacterium]
MILSQNQSYQIGPYQLVAVKNLLTIEHRGHEVYEMRLPTGELVVCKVATNQAAADQMAHEFTVLNTLHDVSGIVRSKGLFPFGQFCALLVDYINAPHVARGRIHVTALPEHRALTWPVVVALMYDGTKILQQAHERHIIHSDIKPQNFLYTADKKIFLFDWDHSLILPAQPDKHVPVEGTPQFMAPEQVRHEPVDARTDIYSLGVSCVSLLYGARISPRYTVTGEVVAERTNPDIVKALRVNETIKYDLMPAPLNNTEAALQALWRKMTAADPKQRPQSVQELRASLPVLSDQA